MKRLISDVLSCLLFFSHLLIIIAAFLHFLCGNYAKS